QVAGTVVDALHHQDYPFPLLVERLKVRRDPTRTPLVQVTFALDRAHRPGDAVGLLAGSAPAGGGLPAPPPRGGFQTGPFPVGARSCPTGREGALEEAGGAVEGIARYNADLFDAGTTARLVEHFLTLLEEVAAGADRRVTQLP